MNRQEEEISRRDFLVYHLSPALAGGGIAIAMGGALEDYKARVTAKEDRNRVQKNLQNELESACIQLTNNAQQEDCLKKAGGIVNESQQFLTRYEKARWYELRGDEGKNFIHFGAAFFCAGIMIKAVDFIIQRRIANQGR
ncbi:hypothetical protein HY439_00110 [Candidatus Microgenomates bacterium]|nr:hypothetical protein [Candidatus Microgenomates bacterium]